MPLFLIDQNFAELLQQSAEAAGQIEQVGEELGVEWLNSFLRAYNKNTYCLYQVNDPESLMEHSRSLGIPADVIFITAIAGVVCLRSGDACLVRSI